MRTLPKNPPPPDDYRYNRQLTTSDNQNESFEITESTPTPQLLEYLFSRLHLADEMVTMVVVILILLGRVVKNLELYGGLNKPAVIDKIHYELMIIFTLTGCDRLICGVFNKDSTEIKIISEILKPGFSKTGNNDKSIVISGGFKEELSLYNSDVYVTMEDPENEACKRIMDSIGIDKSQSRFIVSPGNQNVNLGIVQIQWSKKPDDEWWTDISIRNKIDKSHRILSYLLDNLMEKRPGFNLIKIFG